MYVWRAKAEWYFAYAQDELNQRILEGIFPLDIRLVWHQLLYIFDDSL